MGRLTEWEIGQDLIAVSYFMSNTIYEFKINGHQELAEELNKLRAKVGDLFNKNNDHDFGIFDSDCYDESLKDKLNDKLKECGE